MPKLQTQNPGRKASRIWRQNTHTEAASLVKQGLPKTGTLKKINNVGGKGSEIRTMVPISKQFCMGILAAESWMVINWTVDGGSQATEHRIYSSHHERLETVAACLRTSVRQIPCVFPLSPSLPRPPAARSRPISFTCCHPAVHCKEEGSLERCNGLEGSVSETGALQER